MEKMSPRAASLLTLSAGLALAASAGTARAQPATIEDMGNPFSSTRGLGGFHEAPSPYIKYPKYRGSNKPHESHAHKKTKAKMAAKSRRINRGKK